MGMATVYYSATAKGGAEYRETLRLEIDAAVNVSVQVFLKNDSALYGNPYVDSTMVLDTEPGAFIMVLTIMNLTNTVNEGSIRFINKLTNRTVGSVKVEIVPQGCKAGKYGAKCDKDCICQHPKTCHAFNGACKCDPGWKGPACDIAYECVEISPAVTNLLYGGYGTLWCAHYNFDVIEETSVKWYHNGSLVEENSSFDIHFDFGTGQSSLSIRETVDSNAGSYDCEVLDVQTGWVYNATGMVFINGCETNRWGRTCEVLCNCENSISCDRYEGCICYPGWNGTECSRDIQSPVIVDCPEDIVISASEKKVNRVTWKEPTVSDNSKDLSLTSNFQPGQAFGYGEHTVTYRAEDEGGNVAVCEFQVTVRDITGGISKAAKGVLSVLAVFMVALCVLGPYVGYRYKREIQTIIANKLRPYEDDDGRRYDAFVSVRGHTEDEDFVYKELLPTLEKKYGFRLCVHHRDFIIGEAIIENIVTAIRESRRTILVLSPSFVESDWCDYELALAHTEMISLRQKLIPIMFDDITRMANLRASLQSILNTITYIEWPREGADRDREKFWKKLVRALPRKREADLAKRKVKRRCWCDFSHMAASILICIDRLCQKIRRKRVYVKLNADIADDDIPLIQNVGQEAPPND
ncbi:uncharacterized protein [Ptychodera flava]|uniref:uncharacterized protein n=1 Tax=Ptychodera flava TaxID=63121 RepID=UPI00396A7C00